MDQAQQSRLLGKFGSTVIVVLKVQSINVRNDLVLQSQLQTSPGQGSSLLLIWDDA